MKTQDQFKPINDLGVLLVGPPLSGKTCVAMQFPAPYIISTDHKIKNAVQLLPPGKQWWFDYVDTDDNGKPVAEADQWTRATTLLKKGCADPNVQTVIWDNLSDLSGILQSHIIANGGTKLRVGGEQVFEMSHWQPFKLLLQRAIAYARGSGKIFVLCCHETVERDEVSGMLTYLPLIPGQLRGQLGGYFTDVWRTEVDVVPGKPPRYYVRTTPTPRQALGHSVLGLPSEFVFDWNKFAALMSGSQKEPDLTGNNKTNT